MLHMCVRHVAPLIQNLIHQEAKTAVEDEPYLEDPSGEAYIAAAKTPASPSLVPITPFHSVCQTTFHLF